MSTIENRIGLKKGDIVYLPFVLFGSGTPFPIGAFTSPENVEVALGELGKKKATFTLELPLDENWELSRRAALDEISRLGQEIEEAKPEFDVRHGQDRADVYRLVEGEYKYIGGVLRREKHGRWEIILPNGYDRPWTMKTVDYKDRKKAINQLKNFADVLEEWKSA